MTTAGRGSTARSIVRIALLPVRFVAAIAILGLLKVVEPFVRIRIVALSSRMGLLALDTEAYLRRRASSPPSPREIHVFVTREPANRQLLTMVKRRVWVIEDRVSYSIFLVMQRCAPNSSVWLPFGHLSEVMEYEDLSLAPPQMAFTQEEEARGAELLRRMGIGHGQPFVCFHSRDSTYLARAYGVSADYWRYHDCRDTTVENYLPAAEYLASIGIVALRMGSVVDRPIASKHPGVIDYATTYRSDFGDIYLPSHCKFFLGNTSGLVCVPYIFNVPVVDANQTPVKCVSLGAPDLFVFKKLWDRALGRALSLPEILSRGAHLLVTTEEFEAAGIELIENTPDEIVDAAKEMNSRLDGTWVTTDEDERLQRRFRELFDPACSQFGHFTARLSAAFLRQNPGWLE